MIKEDNFMDDMEMDNVSVKDNKPMMAVTVASEMSTMSDVIECLKKDFAEEIADTKKYLCMAKIADSAGMEDDSHYLLEMARDEYTHVRFIHEFMEKHNIRILEAHERCYKELEGKMTEFF